MSLQVRLSFLFAFLGGLMSVYPFASVMRYPMILTDVHHMILCIHIYIYVCVILSNLVYNLYDDLILCSWGMMAVHAKIGRASILRNGGPLDSKVTSSLIFFYNCVSHCEPIFVNNANFNNGEMPLIFCIGKLLRWHGIKSTVGLRFPYGIPYGNWGLAFCRMSPVLAPSAVTLFAHIKSRTLSFSTSLFLFSEKVHEFDTH